jgi:hypothetical protein
VFVPWHAAFAIMLKWAGVAGRAGPPQFRIPEMSRRGFSLVGISVAGYLIAICYLAPFLLLQMKILFNDLPVIFAVSEAVAKKTGGKYEVEVKYQVAKTIPADVECHMELGGLSSSEGTVSYGVDPTAITVQSYLNQESSTFTVRVDQVNDISVRLNCSGARFSNYHSDWAYVSVTKPDE